MLGDDFKHRETVEKWPGRGVASRARSGVRRVRTARGSKVFGQPIGTIITRDMIERAKRERGRGGNEKRDGGRAQGARREPEAFNPKRGASQFVDRRAGARSDTPITPKQRAMLFKRKINEAKEVTTLGKIFDILERDEEAGKFANDPDLAEDLYDALYQREVDLERDEKQKQKLEAARARGKGSEGKQVSDKPKGAIDAPPPKGKPVANLPPPKEYEPVKPAQKAPGPVKPAQKQPPAPKQQEPPAKKNDHDPRSFDSWKRQVLEAQSEEDLEKMLDYIESLPKNAELADGRDWDDVFDLIESKSRELKAIESAGNFTGGKLTPEQRRRLFEAKKVRAVAADAARLDPKAAEKTPAGIDIKRGVPLDRLTNPEGMLDYIKSHPGQYTINGIAGGQGGAFEVIDKFDRDKKYFFKRPLNGGVPEEGSGSTLQYGDAANEVFVGQYGNQLFPNVFPNVEFAEVPTADSNGVLRMDHVDEFAKKQGWDVDKVYVEMRAAYFEENRQHGQNLADPKEALVVHIMDYVTNQTDRHVANYALVKNKDGKFHIVPTDNGASFHAYTQYQRDAYTLQMGGKDPDLFPEEVVFAPENISYSDWSGYFVTGQKLNVRPIGLMYGYGRAEEVREFLSKGSNIADEVRGGYAENYKGTPGQTRSAMLKDAKDIIERMKATDPDDIVADLLRRFPDMDDYDREHLEANAMIVKARLANLRAEDVVKVMFG